MTRKEFFKVTAAFVLLGAINLVVASLVPEGMCVAFLISAIAGRLGMKDGINLRKPPPTPKAPTALPLSPISQLATPAPVGSFVAPTSYYGGGTGSTQTYAAPATNRVYSFLERLYGAQRAPQSVNPFVGSAAQAKQNWLNRIFVG